jgi:hypothetical protein
LREFSYEKNIVKNEFEEGMKEKDKKKEEPTAR